MKIIRRMIRRVFKTWKKNIWVEPDTFPVITRDDWPELFQATPSYFLDPITRDDWPELFRRVKVLSD